jgi:biotin carboxyl carrier protein
MTFELEVAGQLADVTVHPGKGSHRDGGTFTVTIRRKEQSGDVDSAPQTLVVDARRTPAGLSVLFPGDGRSLDAGVVHSSGGAVLVQLPHVDVSVLIDGRRRKHRGSLSETGEQRVTAPMPGRILKVLVRPGDEIAAGQALVVIEAMKMENDLKAVRAGRVREVLVTEASSVEAGRLLVIVD